jgi:hypothetical protein
MSHFQAPRTAFMNLCALSLLILAAGCDPRPPQPTTTTPPSTTTTPSTSTTPPNPAPSTTTPPATTPAPSK